MVFSYDERSVGMDVVHSYAPGWSTSTAKFSTSYGAPLRVPCGGADPVPGHERRRPKLIKCELVVARWEHPIGVERRERKHETIMINFTFKVKLA